MRHVFWAVAGVAAWIAGCDMDLEQPFEVGASKLMGVRLEVEGDAIRAWPRARERFNLRWFVARSTAPTTRPLPEQLDIAASLCVGSQLPAGGLYCALELDVSAGAPPPRVASFEEIVLPLELSVDPGTVPGGQRLLFFGAVCVEGKVERVPGKKVGEDPANELYRCTDNKGAELKTPLSFTNTVVVDDPGDAFAANLNPSFACASDDARGICRQGTDQAGEEERRGGPIVLVLPRKKGAPASSTRTVIAWKEVLDATEPLPSKGCASDERFKTLRVKVGADKHLIRLRFDPQDRETYQTERVKFNKTQVVTEREELLVSHAATRYGGKLDRYFSIVARDEPDDSAEIEVEYTPPEKQEEDAKKRVPTEGRLVRFYFMVRDQRGGADFTTRSLCLVP